MGNGPKTKGLPARRRDRSIFNKLSDGLIQLGSAEDNEAAAARNLPSPQKKKGQPLSQDGWLFFFVPIVAEAVSALKEAGRQALRVLWPRLEGRQNLTGWRRTRTPNRPARHVF